MRSSPMKRSGFKRKEPGYISQFKRSTPLIRASIKNKASRKRATKAERTHMGTVAGLCCVVCRNMGFSDSPAEVHHVRFLAGGGQRSGHRDTLPLCPRHHRTGGYSVAIHAGQEIWESMYGTECDLLNQTKREMGLLEAA